MYGAADRERVLGTLEQMARDDDRCVAMVLVGSGARGFTDALSDIDVIVVVSPQDVESVSNEMSELIVTNFNVLAQKLYRHTGDVHVSCFLLPDYLNLDLGIWSEPALFATRPDWRVVFDETGGVEEKLLATWKPANVPTLADVVAESLSWIWQPLRSAIVAERRGDVLKADFQRGLVRQEIVKINAAALGVAPDELQPAQQGSLKDLVHLDTNDLFERYQLALEDAGYKEETSAQLATLASMLQAFSAVTLRA